MSYDPFRNYDAWVTREPDTSEGRLLDAWYAFVDHELRGRAPETAVEADDPDHAIYEAWEKLELLLDARENRLQDEADAAYAQRLAEDEALAQEDLI